MSYPPGTTVWVAGQRLDADDLNDWMQNLPWGLVAEASITSNSSAFTTLADVASLTVTFTALANRYYVVEFFGEVSSTVSGDYIRIRIADGSNNGLKDSRSFIGGASAPTSFDTCTARLAPGAGSITYKIRAERISGSGTCTVQGASTSPSGIRVLDVGPV